LTATNKSSTLWSSRSAFLLATIGGLGLAITYGIVQEHGGTIHAANSRDGGAVFTIELPVA
jgi:signal transduction histidine kinase